MEEDEENMSKGKTKRSSLKDTGRRTRRSFKIKKRNER